MHSSHQHRDHDHDHDHDHDGNCPSQEESESLSDFHSYGVRFQFPSDWTLTEQSNDDETTITVQSEGTSFWTIMLLGSRPDPDAVLDTIVETFEQEYEDVDVLSTIQSLDGLPALGRDLDFVCYDLVNSAIARACQTADRTVLVLYQGTDHELKSTRSQMEAITSSLVCEEE